MSTESKVDSYQVFCCYVSAVAEKLRASCHLEWDIRTLWWHDAGLTREFHMRCMSIATSTLQLNCIM